MSAIPDDLGEQWAESLRQAAAEDHLNGFDRDDTDRMMRENPDVLGFPFTWAADYPAVKAPETVIGNLIERGSLVEVFGDSNTGKSTLVLEMASAVATGARWRDRRTKHGIVLWVALESAAGLRRRVTAYRQHHKLGDAELLFADITVAVRLLDVQNVESVVQTAKNAEMVARHPCMLIVVDTVARALAGGDENDGRDMGTLIRSCDMIRHATGAAVLLIHHSGKDSTRGARGHSSLRAAVDTEIEVSGQDNPRQAKVTKQRDLPSGDTFAFDLEAVTIGQDDETGEAITACVVVHRDDVPQQRKVPSGRNQQLMLGAIRQRVAEHGDIIATPDWHNLCKAQGLKKPRWSETRDRLIRDGWLVETIGGVRYVP